ncbi:TPA: NAD(P)-dependent oxidoreductase [Providencia rettgeri]|nr:NAD(P)-dependent oxidoreductase [Providencia rettgeri]
MSKILITGGSGFIGTNLINSLLSDGYQIINLDIVPPLNISHQSIYEYCDIRHFEILEKKITSFSPDYIIHLAARTDLNGKSPDDYNTNTVGVENLCNISSNITNLKKIIFTSSMLVCKSGYQPNSSIDYCPDTAYGLSKVEGEKIVHKYNEVLPSHYIIRPTSIWGPWFREPYRNFFDIVLSGKFLDIGNKYCTKTYGYIGNSVNQIKSLLLYSKIESSSVIYIGDNTPLNISKWANEICSIANIRKPIKIPFFMISILSYIGDLLSTFNISFPMTSFRLKNMITNNIINCDLACNENIFDVISNEKAITDTLNWIKREH